MERFSKTKRLYYENSYEKSFTALVTGVGEDEHGEYVLLDQTLFFPEGGGQPSDRGTLGGHDVVDVQLVEGEIRHYIRKELEKGDSVDGMIDWDRRFDLMQQHSGEHMVSGMIHRRFGYDNVGFHMGERFVTIDINGLIDEDQLSEIEQAVNAYIWTNQASRVFFADEEEKTSLPYRSKLELTDEVRLVEFPGADLCACCGLHVGLAGEVGLVKLVSVHRFRQGVRIEMLSGRRAFDYLNSHFRQNSHIATALSVKPGETLEAVGRMQEENYRLRGEIIKRDRERYRQIAGACQGKGNVVLFARDFSPEDIRKCTDEVLDSCGGVCVLFSGDDARGYRYAAGVREGDVRDLARDMNQELSGRGGGKPLFVQGSVKTNQDRIRAYFEEKDYTIFGGML